MTRLKALLKMTRRKAILTGVSLLALVGVVVGGIQLVEAMQSGEKNTDMTKSVARIVWGDGSFCTGSVVGDQWILTAAHCLYPEHDLGGKMKDWSTTKVQLWKAGMDASELYESKLDQKPIPMDGGTFTYRPYLYRDVALLHLAKPMYSWVKTIPTAPQWPSVGTNLYEFGYGFLDKNNSVPANALYKSHQGSIKRSDCPNVKGFSWDWGNLCISYSDSHARAGDSGGPLLWSNNGYWQQVGDLSGTIPPTSMYDFWSEADSGTRNWILKTVGANFAYGTILRDQVSGASWIYGANGYEDDLYRHWIPDGATYNCLVNNGAKVLNRSLRTIEALPDMVGNHAHCAPRSPTPTPQPTATAGPTAPTATPGSTPPTPTPTATTAPVQHNPVDAYSNYGQSNLLGHAMCRGNPDNSLSMPGGIATQTFKAPSGVATLSSAKIQVDPAPVTAHLSVAVNGKVVASTAATAVGDTHFNFGPVGVHAGDTITLTISFTATAGKIITLYTVGNPGGKFTATNTCPDGAPNYSTTTAGLRAVVSGMS